MREIKKALDEQNKELSEPMGVSQWMNYGEKYHYDEYFKEQLLNQVIEIIEKTSGQYHGGGNGRRLFIQVEDEIRKLTNK